MPENIRLQRFTFHTV